MGNNHLTDFMLLILKDLLRFQFRVQVLRLFRSNKNGRQVVILLQIQHIRAKRNYQIHALSQNEIDATLCRTYPKDAILQDQVAGIFRAHEYIGRRGTRKGQALNPSRGFLILRSAASLRFRPERSLRA